MKKFVIWVSFIWMFVVVFTAGCSKDVSTANSIKKLKFNDIKSARVQLSRGVTSTEENYTFDLKNSEQTKILKDIVDNLNSGKVQTDANIVESTGGTPRVLILELNNKSVMYIQDAYGINKTKSSSDGTLTGIKLYDIPDEVIVSTNYDEKPIRILSPELRNFMDYGYTILHNN